MKKSIDLQSSFFVDVTLFPRMAVLVYGSNNSRSGNVSKYLLRWSTTKLLKFCEQPPEGCFSSVIFRLLLLPQS